MAGVPGSLFGCSDAGDAGWLRIILQTGVSGCSTQYFLASAVRLSISSRFAKDVGVGVCLTNSQSSGLSLQILSRISCMRSAMGLAGYSLVTGSVFTGLSPILQSSESG